MAKIYGLFGAMTGKLADTVMSVRNGEQIARKYQPVVFNPSTPAQVAVRARLKLMSQLSAVMASVIAIPRIGAVSSRNLFTKMNHGFTSYNSTTNQAEVALGSIQLTRGVISAPVISNVFRSESGGINIRVNPNTVPADANRIVYAAFRKNGNSLELHGSDVATSAGEPAYWQGSVADYDGELVVYAYAVRDNTENARVTFGNLQAVTAEAIAKLLVTRTLTESDITLTKTSSFTLPAVTP